MPTVGPGSQEHPTAADASASTHRSSPSVGSVSPQPSYPPWFVGAAVVTAFVAICIRLYRLEELPGEVFGDISIVLDYVTQVMEGDWPTHFFLSTGPLYHYAIAPILALTGVNYFGLKLASVVASLLVLIATFALSRRLVDDRFALLATFVAATSSWLLAYSRIGYSQIAVPLLSTTALWLAVRAAQRGSRTDLVACGVVSALGLYVYPQSFILPGVSAAVLVGLRWSGHPVRWRDLALFTAVTLVVALPFAAIVARDPYEFTSGYIGGKLHAAHPLRALAANTVNAALAFHIRGDIVSRNNPQGVPHLDPVSGLLFLAGLALCLLPGRRRLAAAVVVPFVLLQVPAILVLQSPDQVPSTSRTIAVVPLAAILVATGLYGLVETLQGIAGRAAERRSMRAAGAGVLGAVVTCALLAAILALNLDRYFRRYVATLPFENTSVGLMIARWADTLPPVTHVYMVGCCWVYGMPEPWAVTYAMSRSNMLHRYDPEQLHCDDLALFRRPAMLVWDYRTALPGPHLAPCAESLLPQLYCNRSGDPAFVASPVLLPPLASLADRLSASSDAGDPLLLESARLGDRAVGVRHSPFDTGSVPALVDGDPESKALCRGTGRLVLELHFVEPPTASRIILELGPIPGARLALEVIRPDGSRSAGQEDLARLPPDSSVETSLPGGPGAVAVLRLTLQTACPSRSRCPDIWLHEVRLD